MREQRLDVADVVLEARAPGPRRRAPAPARRAARPRASRRPRSWRTTRRSSAAPARSERGRRAPGSAAVASSVGQRARLVDELRRGRGPVGIEQAVGQRLVEHQRAEMEPAVAQHRAEVLGFVQRRGFERGDDREGRAPVVQQPLDRLRTLDEAVVHRLEVEEELGDVLRGTCSRARDRRVGRRAGSRS